jgi:acyl phosphate:glycerol-3-phosphate acyltransferase
MELLFIAIISYLLGSIPSGLVLAKIFKKGDIRKKGSGNIGATNALRVGGKALGIATLVADVLKGIIAVMIAQYISDYDLGHVCIAALCAVLGHVFPVWLKLNGGKGVATTIAVLLYVAPGVGLIGMLMWIATFVTTRMVSAASIVMMASATLSAFISQPDEVVLLALSTSIIVIARHSENIKRILKGTENKM